MLIHVLVLHPQKKENAPSAGAVGAFNLLICLLSQLL